LVFSPQISDDIPYLTNLTQNWRNFSGAKSLPLFLTFSLFTTSLRQAQRGAEAQCLAKAAGYQAFLSSIFIPVYYF